MSISLHSILALHKGLRQKRHLTLYGNPIQIDRIELQAVDRLALDYTWIEDWSQGVRDRFGRLGYCQAEPQLQLPSRGD
jgi:hypothetical protein